MEKKNVLYNSLLDGLLNLSEKDTIIAKELLIEEGVNIENSISSSLKNIEEFKSQLQMKVQRENNLTRVDYLLEKLKNSLNHDFQKFNECLRTLMPGQENSYAFKNSKLFEEKELIDLNKLEELVSKLDKSN